MDKKNKRNMLQLTIHFFSLDKPKCNHSSFSSVILIVKMEIYVANRLVILSTFNLIIF